MYGIDDAGGVEFVWHEGVRGGGAVELVAHGEKIRLNLEPSGPRLDTHFAIISRLNDSSHLLPQALVEPSCYYTSKEPYRAALNICNGMSGILSIDKRYYYTITPLPESIYERKGPWIPHMVVKRSVGSLNLVPSGIETSRTPIHIETAVFVDKDLYRHMSTNFVKDTDQQLITFVLTLVNAVQLLYHDPSLGRPVSFIMKRLEILHTDPATLHRSEDIDKFLSNFCNWQSEENPPDDSNPLHWDHALMLTGLDLYVLSKNGKISKQVVGLAPVAGMCSAASSCTVNEGRHFESVYVVAHEIGHNLGMRHDGPVADNLCDPGSYLMSPTLGSGKITWSPCSKQYLNQFLRSPQSHCLMDHSSSSTQLDHGGDGLLPGERFDADQQCMLKYGRGSTHAATQPISDLCLDLHCMRDRYTWTSHPALEGTSCGKNRWCRRGRCLDKEQSLNQAYQVVKGGWSEWTPYSECASGCLHDNDGNLIGGSTGVQIAARLCNNPRPENGGHPCVGSDKKYKTCTPTQCEKIEKTRIQSFASEICSRAREVDNHLSGTGFQKMSSDPEEACTVWCHKRAGGIHSKGWTFPDGTACQTNRRHRPMYCIAGVCQEFLCSNDEDEVFILSPSMCSSSQLFSRDKRREVAVGVWQPISDCYYNCITSAVGLQLVEKRPCRYCNTTSSIKTCQPNSKFCQDMKTPTEYATTVCTRYSGKVRRLSGFGIQLLQTQDDEDRACRIACQDETVPNRFYLVNGEEGWFPFGTDCGKNNPSRLAYCVSGKCLDFNIDGSPIHESVNNFPRFKSRRKRSYEIDSSTWKEYEPKDKEGRVNAHNTINFSNPIDVDDFELTYRDEINFI
ncbi:Reprolysin (M12B) family zinc metalloprotease [Nesidiocoris tenuis]|uniref:Reprolysin (M12B) family zinc metalloprotease n=1 Tax=Nesidiocoris tenuis TaxID=355587 RepID=A0ABN7AH89_9HEMI|nr:Reprolysin (M12B) family zinc metalloprotease [Nesidiocoris tenuis]